MIYRRRKRTSLGNGFYRFESLKSRHTIYGAAYGEYIRLRDEFGNVWRGEAEIQEDDSVRYRFRDGNGQVISGVADDYGIVLRDSKGNTWRGFID